MLARRNDLFEPFMELQKEIDRLFSDFVRPFRSEFEFLPKVDAYETEDKVVLELELPGVKKDELKITVEDGVLRITGEKKTERDEKGRNYRIVERSFGKFERSFIIPDYVDMKGITAKYTDGVLTLEMPKKKEEKPTVEIKIE
ncbi:MAG: Hsp20/alpha crystallin family protein [Fervidobacterium sp.]|uniref:Hsp20/alpha crystallin family protein n=1 Tax=Fervidobacterium sp. TaxID=1871331 RepID=UPI004049B662